MEVCLLLVLPPFFLLQLHLSICVLDRKLWILNRQANKQLFLHTRNGRFFCNLCSGSLSLHQDLRKRCTLVSCTSLAPLPCFWICYCHPEKLLESKLRKAHAQIHFSRWSWLVHKQGLTFLSKPLHCSLLRKNNRVLPPLVMWKDRCCDLDVHSWASVSSLLWLIHLYQTRFLASSWFFFLQIFADQQGSTTTQ